MGITHFYIGSLQISSYVTMITLAIIICTLLILNNLNELQWTKGQFLKLVIFTVIAGLFGARLYYSLLFPESSTLNPLRSFLLNKGLSIDGAIVLGIITIALYTKAHKLPFLNTMDFMVAYSALGESIMRIGCFLNSCCYGQASPYGIYCPIQKEILYPTQIILSAGMLTIYLILRKAYYHRGNTGDIFILYLILRSALYFFVDFLRVRYYPLLFFISGFQITYLLIFICSGLLFIKSSLKHK